MALTLIEAEAKRLGIHAIHLMVRPQNTAALRLYQSVGFQAAPRVLLTHRL